MLSFTLTPIWSCSGWRSKRNRRDICHLSRTRHFKLQRSRGPGLPQHTLHHQIILCICYFFLFLFLIARWLEPPCFSLPSARSTTRQTPRFLRGGSNRTIFFPYIDNFHSGVICVLRQLGHLFATLFSTIFPSALALSWSDWSSSTLASALDIMQGEHSVFLCFKIQ